MYWSTRTGRIINLILLPTFFFVTYLSISFGFNSTLPAELAVHWNAKAVVDRCSPKATLFWSGFGGFLGLWGLLFVELAVKKCYQKLFRRDKTDSQAVQDASDRLIADDQNERFRLWLFVAALPGWSIILFTAASIIEGNHQSADCYSAEVPDVSVCLLVLSVGVSVVWAWILEGDMAKFQLISDPSPAVVGTYKCFSRSLLYLLCVAPGAIVLLTVMFTTLKWSFSAVIGTPVALVFIITMLSVGIDLRVKLIRSRGIQISGPWHLWQKRIFFKDIMGAEMSSMKWTQVGGWGVKRKINILAFLWRSGEGILIHLKNSKKIFISIDDAQHCLRDLSSSLLSYNRLIDMRANPHSLDFFQSSPGISPPWRTPQSASDLISRPASGPPVQVVDLAI